ncbi:MAG: hypothetical protein R2809_06870 [Flavobacteriales bacterium]
MNTRKFTLVLFVAVASMMGVACKKNKKVIEEPKPKGEVLIQEYCTGDEYNSTKEVFRASATGESMDRETAKKKSRSNASAALAKSISATMKIVGDNYVNSTEFNNKEEVTETFQEMARTVVDQELRGAIERCQRTTQKEDGTYVSYMCLELSGAQIADAYANSLSQNEKIKADYNYEKFKETFEAEMAKFGENK